MTKERQLQIQSYYNSLAALVDNDEAKNNLIKRIVAAFPNDKALLAEVLQIPSLTDLDAFK